MWTKKKLWTSHNFPRDAVCVVNAAKGVATLCQIFLTHAVSHAIVWRKQRPDRALYRSLAGLAESRENCGQKRFCVLFFCCCSNYKKCVFAAHFTRTLYMHICARVRIASCCRPRPAKISCGWSSRDKIRDVDRFRPYCIYCFGLQRRRWGGANGGGDLGDLTWVILRVTSYRRKDDLENIHVRYRLVDRSDLGENPDENRWVCI